MRTFFKKYKHKKNKYNAILFFVILPFLFISIGFSAFQTNLEIDGVAVNIIPQKDIRIIEISSINAESGAVSTSEEYDDDGVKLNIDLPSENSKITYEIKITNIGNIEMALANITGLPDNLTYSFSPENYNLKEKICDDNNSNSCKLGITKTILMTIEYAENGYNENSTSYLLDLAFDFKQIYSISYIGFLSTEDLPTSIVEDYDEIIIFENKNGIPVDVMVTGATGLYSNPTLTLYSPTDNVTIEKKHLITYVLDGGVQPENQITSIYSGETVDLLKPTKEKYVFGGWYDNSNFEGNSITSLSNIQSDITLYAKWTEFEYSLPSASFDGTAQTIINTGVKLYSTENVNENFRIAFTIDDYNTKYDDASNINNSFPPTILSSMVETASPYSGFVFRVVKNNDIPVYSMKINDSHVTSFLGNYSLQTPMNVEILRENGAIYTRINTKIFTKVLTYSDSIDTFDVPLTIGGNINGKGEYDRLFDGTLSNVEVEFYEGSKINEAYSYKETRTDNTYSLDGTINFDGTNYIDTGINLFSATNINKDFDIEFTLEAIGENAAQGTLVNAKDESNSKYPGFVYRYNNKQMSIAAKWPNQSDASFTDSVATPKTIKISRKNSVIYYSINGSTEKKLIATPASGLSSEFISNLTFGASSKYDSGTGQINPMRFFKGIVSDISVELYDE